MRARPACRCGHVVVGGGDRLVGGRERCGLEPRPSRPAARWRLVDEVQVDVDEPVRDLGGVETRRTSPRRRPPAQSGGTHGETWRGSPRREVMRRSASKVTLSPAPSRGAVVDHRAPTHREQQTAVRAPRARAAADRRRRPVAAPGREPVDRDVRALAGQRRRQLLGAVAAPLAARRSPERMTTTCSRPRRGAGAGTGSGRARRRSARRPSASGWSAALHLGEHRRRDAAALGEVAQRQAHRLAQRLDPGPDRCAFAFAMRPVCTLSRTFV